MCGIVGYTGPREAGPILIEGLKRLEYRGYDSAGIALVDDAGDLFVEKRAGQAGQPPDGDRRPDARTRRSAWRTPAGRPTAGRTTSTPIPTRTARARSRSSTTGSSRTSASSATASRPAATRLTSETDTEAIAHLVEEAYEGDLADAVRARPAADRGRLRHRRHASRRGRPARRRPPGRAARRRARRRRELPRLATSPRSSPTPTRSSSSRRATSPTSGRGASSITDVDGDAREREVTTIDWSPEAAEKGGYEHFMLKEIHEQPEALAQSIAGRVTRDGRIHVEEIDGLRDTLRAVDRIELVACGSAYYAALIGAAALQDWTGLPARATVGSEFRYGPPPLDERTLVIAVTQSGETADTIAPMRLARERGCPIIAVTNTVGSAITREADAVLFLQAGPEIAVAASQDVRDPGDDAARPGGRDRPTSAGTLDEDDELAFGDGAAGAARRGRAGARATPRRAPRPGPPLRQLARVHVRRARLRLPGGARGRAEAQGGQLRPRRGLRGRRAEARPDLAAGRRVPAGGGRDASSVYDKLISNVMEGRARDARVIAVATEGDAQIERFADDVCWVPDTHEALRPVLAIIPLQLFAYHVAIARGTDVDQPRNLAKSVTVE